MMTGKKVHILIILIYFQFRLFRDTGHRLHASDRFVDFVCRFFVGTVQEDEIFLGQCRRMKYFWDSAGG